jgi:hypothetical protein
VRFDEQPAHIRTIASNDNGNDGDDEGRVVPSLFLGDHPLVREVALAPDQHHRDIFVRVPVIAHAQ